MKQLAVDWLYDQMNNIKGSSISMNGSVQFIEKELNKLFEQAKAMEKEQMHKCASFWRGKENEIEKPIFEQYYKETFNQNKMKQTAVEWLLDNLAYNQNLVGLKEIIEKAIKMEEQQNDDFYQLGYMTCKNDIYYDYDENYQSYKKIGNIISKEDFNLKMFDTTSEHAKEYGLNAKKPLYLQSFSINENKRLNGIGNAVIKYINDYAIKNKNDIIFGHIPQNADFTKDSRESFLPNIDMIKYWLKDKGYTINNDNNDFHKILNNSETLKE